MKFFKISVCFLIVILSCTSNKKIFEPIEFSEGSVSTLLSFNAHSVIRNSETVVEIKSPSETNLLVKKATTIFDKENKDAGDLVLYYSSLAEIEYMKANIINSQGKVVRSFTEKDAQDYSAYDGFSFFSDNRVKVLNLDYNSFPYTVEIEYKKKYNGGLFLPSWYPQNIGQAVEKSSLKVIDYTKGVRYHTRNLKSDPTVIDSVETNTFEWEVSFLTAKERENYGPPVQEILPVVLLSPSEFEIEKTKGNASNWKDFGKWYYTLGEGSRELSSEAIVEVEEVIKGKDTEKEKVEALYNYLQSKTRYVSIQLGIGGWKPFPANYVFENEYGDCKALTNYMQAILEHVGIKSNSVLISTGTNEANMITEFPSNQFNHVILRVELSNGEVIWLECTSKYYPPGHIGSGNENKNALLISEFGGEIIETPTSTANDNISSSISNIELDKNGSATISTKISNYGTQQEYLLNVLKPISENARIEWLEKRMDKSDFKLTKTDFSGIFVDSEAVYYSYSAEFQKFASTSNSRIFVPLKTSNSWNFNPDLDENRRQEIWLSYEFSERDTVFYELPNEYIIESIPSSKEIEEPFGTYKINYIGANNGKFEIQRELIIKQNKLEAEQYNAFRRFFNEVSKYDNAQLVLAKKD